VPQSQNGGSEQGMKVPALNWDRVKTGIADIDSSGAPESYGYVIQFYNEALAQVTANERADLGEHDRQTQPTEFRQRNTIVRIMDKYLRMKGKQPRP